MDKNARCYGNNLAVDKKKALMTERVRGRKGEREKEKNGTKNTASRKEK